MNNDNRLDVSSVSDPGEKKLYSVPELTEYGNLDEITGGLGFALDASAAFRARITILV